MEDGMYMESRQLLQQNFETKMTTLTEKINDRGYIEELPDLMNVINELSGMDSYPEAERYQSELFSMLAQSQRHLHGEDSLYETWLKQAIAFDNSNQRANELMAKSGLNKYSDFMKPFSFPLIRETDNRTAKKKIAERYISQCKEYLLQITEMNPIIVKNLDIARKYSGSEIIEKYVRVAELLKEAETELTALLKSAEEYEESISGVFHTATHFQDMKKYLDQLMTIKDQWEELFQMEGENQVQEKTPLQELQAMIGLTEVKTRVNDHYRFIQYQNKRKELGLQIKDEQSLNMVLTGNPGTGKTTIARLLAKIYHELGVLPREEVLEVDRTQLVGAYIGQTEEKVQAAVEKSLGGVLFIDEAYSLKREGQSGNDYGQTAIDTLVSLMTSQKYGGKFAVILAGYPDEMRQFLQANPGLRSRFPQSNTIHLPDYETDELLQIAEKMAMDNDYFLTNGARTELESRLEAEKVDETFGNARTVRTLVSDAIFKRGAGSSLEEQQILHYTSLTADDFQKTEQKLGMSAGEKLDKLVGLQEIKSEVKSLAAFVEIQQIRRHQGLQAVPIQSHAVFTGNPGTGKTTVAKIYSELLKESGMLKRGHLIVAGRTDFVAGFVGQTAIKTKKKIREALGGVLFIDEAYSLLSQSETDFGKEVIDTFVEEMTKHNENLVVVLAGYTKEMNRLLESNPGLRSRFKKFIHFPDYTDSELVEIIQNYAKSYEYHLEPAAVTWLKDYLSQHKIKGNGRFATNLIDEAIQIQAMRIIEKTIEMESPDLTQLTEDDVKKATTKLGRSEA